MYQTLNANLLRRETGRSVGTIFGDQLQGDEKMCLENVRSLLAHKRIDTPRPEPWLPSPHTLDMLVMDNMN